ncbi:MAG TPA: DUF418 domain-containing protein [Blastocatellia bacterium]|jgi:uncharacterized protein|nr:DUF418 domain-containing protein [Blastocatellia bacterium]
MLKNSATTSNAALALQPVQSGERDPALDVLRGFALFGVLVAYALWNLGSPAEETYGTIDRALNWALLVLVDTKAYTIFAFLFGLGFSLQLTRARGRGANIVPLYCRRLSALLTIGLGHALLLRNGDILVPYAVMGFFLLLFRNAPNKVLAAGAIIGLLFPYLARGVWELTSIPFPQRPDTEGMGHLASNYAWVRYWYATAITNWPASLPMFLCGLYAGRRRFFEETAACRRVLRRGLVAGLCVGTVSYFSRQLLFLINPGWAPSFSGRLVVGLLWTAHAWGLAAFYASSLLLLLQRHLWRRRLAPLGAAGRMALTNYLLQSVMIVPVCIAFGLFDRITPSLGLLLALSVWLIQVPASVWWLKRFRFGPAEWAWRSLTYRNLQPMRAAPGRRWSSMPGAAQ